MDQPAPPYPGGPRQGPFPLQLRLGLGQLLADCGIARVAPVTHLDVIGIPVAAAARPLAVTLRVTHGAGRTDEEAQAEAAEEAIRLWHAESAVPAAAAAGSAEELGPGYRLADLGLPPGMPDAESTPMEWVRALTVPGGHETLVPRGLVRLGRPQGRWRPGMLAATDIGLAAGACRDAAVARALFDVMERDALEGLRAGPDGALRCLDLDTVPDAGCRGLIAKVRASGARLEVTSVPSRFGAACFAATLQMDDTAPLAPGGAAAHCDPAVALARALAGAARSRLVLVAGAGQAHAGPAAGRPRRPARRALPVGRS